MGMFQHFFRQDVGAWSFPKPFIGFSERNTIVIPFFKLYRRVEVERVQHCDKCGYMGLLHHEVTLYFFPIGKHWLCPDCYTSLSREVEKLWYGAMFLEQTKVLHPSESKLFIKSGRKSVVTIYQ